MSIHPNVILMVVLKPDGLSRKTMRLILAEYSIDPNNDDVFIDGKRHNIIVMEEEYHEDYQIVADEGDLIVFDLVTYGYGEWLSWSELERKKILLEQWAEKVSKKYSCTYEIRVSANYW